MKTGVSARSSVRGLGENLAACEEVEFVVVSVGAGGRLHGFRGEARRQVSAAKGSLRMTAMAFLVELGRGIVSSLRSVTLRPAAEWP